MEAHADALRSRAEQDALPIDVDLIVSVAGIKQRLRRWDFAGRIFAEASGQLVMDLNADDGPARQRFTCAHELMHLAFPGFKQTARYRLDTDAPGAHASNREEEYLCDLGAASLLMPRLLLAEYEVSGGLLEVERLARCADVSVQAAGNRMVTLATVPAAFLVLEWMHKPADRPRLRRGEALAPRLRIRYAVTANINAHLPRYKSVDEGSVLDRARSTGRRVRGDATLPGAEALGAFYVEAKTYGTRSQVYALATRAYQDDRPSRAFRKCRAAAKQ